MKKILIFGLILNLVIGACKEETDIPNALNPVISSISPAQGPAKTLVTIRGKRFSTDVSGNIVKFADATAKVVSASDTLLTVEAPEDGATGTVTVKANDRLSRGPVFSYGEVESDYETVLYTGKVKGNAVGTLEEARFNNPEGVVIDSKGNLIVADRSNHVIKNISPDGIVSVIAGTTSGYLDGAANVAKFSNPYKIGIDKDDNIYVADNSNNRIRKIDAITKMVTTVAGSTAGFADGQGTAAKFSGPIAIDCDLQGNIYVADNGNHAIRKITPGGLVTTLAGIGTAGYGDGVWPNVKFNNPSGVTVDSEGFLLVADRRNNRIRRVNTLTGATTTIAGNGTAASTDGNGLRASFNQPFGITLDANGVIYIADLQHAIRKMSPAGDVVTIGGNGTAGDADGKKIDSRFNQPTEVAVDAQGNVFVADLSNGKIKKISKVNR